MLEAPPKHRERDSAVPARTLFAVTSLLLVWESVSQEGALAAFSSVGCPWQDLPKEAESAHLERLALCPQCFWQGGRGREGRRGRERESG